MSQIICALARARARITSTDGVWLQRQMSVGVVPYSIFLYSQRSLYLMLRYLLLSIVVVTAQAAEPQTTDPVTSALAACAAMQERFVDTECTTSRPRAGGYQVTIKAGTADAMRVVFMRSLDVADLLCGAGHKVELTQQLTTSDGARAVRWSIKPPDCGVSRLPD